MMFAKICSFTLIVIILLTTYSCEDKQEKDTSPPTVIITYPIAGSTVSGVITISADVTDNDRVTQVEFIIDGQKQGIVNKVPWQYEWNTESKADGEQHSIYAKAYDEAGNTASSAVVLVTVPEIKYLSVSNDSLHFSSDQTQLSFNITNSGTGTLSWTISDDMTWLSVTPDTGSTTTETAQIAVTVDRTGLSTETYSGTITVTPNTGSPVNVGVTMTVLTYGHLEGYTYYSGTKIPVSGVSANIDNEYYTTSEDGYFILNDIVTGNVVLIATKDGYDEYQITVTIAENNNSINIPMTSALYTHNLYGSITNTDQQTLSNVTVTVLNDDSTESQLQTISDVDGNYQIPNVPQGQRLIKFQKRHYDIFITQIFISNSDYNYNVELESLYGTVSDIDGNTYQTLKIGNQTWMVENLKVSHYQNGDPIPTGHSNSVWSGLSTGAYAIYDDITSNADTYGYLYNLYAVDDSRNIAPEGWHVPTDDEWQTLVDYLGGSSVAGGKLKEAGTAHWNSPNAGATNESGFTALPGGSRNWDYGYYSNQGNFGIFWSATEDVSYGAWVRLLDYYYSYVRRSTSFNMRSGYSVRCVRD